MYITGNQIIKNVEIALPFPLKGNSSSFEQKLEGRPTLWCPLLVELYLEVFAKAAAVVIAHRLGITEALQQRVCLGDDSLDVLRTSTSATDSRDKV